MFTDLGKDWSSGPPSDFNTFVPVIYGLHINCESYEINFYGNDQNIIDRPLDRRDNGKLSIYRYNKGTYN